MELLGFLSMILTDNNFEQNFKYIVTPFYNSDESDTVLAGLIKNLHSYNHANEDSDIIDIVLHNTTTLFIFNPLDCIPFCISS